MLSSSRNSSQLNKESYKMLWKFSKLSALPVTNEVECLEAIAELHRSTYVRLIIVTSGIHAEERDDLFYCYASQRITGNEHDNERFEQFRLEIPVIRGEFVGTGDVFSSLLLVWLEETGGDVRAALCNVIASMQALLRRTLDSIDGITFHFV